VANGNACAAGTLETVVAAAHGIVRIFHPSRSWDCAASGNAASDHAYPLLDTTLELVLGSEALPRVNPKSRLIRATYSRQLNSARIENLTPESLLSHLYPSC